jgi:hypothetical protein
VRNKINTSVQGYAGYSCWEDRGDNSEDCVTGVALVVGVKLPMTSTIAVSRADGLQGLSRQSDAILAYRYH